MKYGLFLDPLMISFLSATVLLLILVFLSRKFFKDDDRNNKRHVHVKGTSRLGGVAVILAFAISLFSNSDLVFTKPLVGVMIASIAIMLFGVRDDFRQLGWKSQLFFQIVVVAFVYYMGVRLEYVTNPFGDIFLLSGTASLFLAIVWIVFLMNAMNWVDGIDGVSASITLVGAASIFFLVQRPEVNQPPIGIITAALFGAFLAFAIFNFHPAKILAGTSGSMFMGFSLGVLAIFAGAKIATTLLVMAIPIIDAGWVVFERFHSKTSIFSADQRHLHYRLLQLGWSQKQICFFYFIVTLLIAFVALNTNALGKAISFILVACLLTTVLAFARSKTMKIQETQ